MNTRDDTRTVSMPTLNILRISRPRACLMLMASALYASGTNAHAKTQQERSDHIAEQEREPPGVTYTRQRRALVLTVTVVSVEEETEAPVDGATVIVFASDHEERHPTDTSGKVTFKFTTAAKTLMLRVVADEWQSQQKQLAIDSAEKTQKVVLTRSD